MEHMTERPSYEQWLKQTNEATAASRRFFGGSEADRPRDDATGHPVGQPYPKTGDEAYDSMEPRRQAHKGIAREVAGFDRRQLDRVRRALDAGESPTLPPGWVHTTAGASKHRR